ncbi:MAG: gamma carbonic anhydrase family protein [Lysobacterales bacterium]|jgi:carbonic anhydrase/acetyltransferase-like protein (isoleucine patch superfamily)
MGRTDTASKDIYRFKDRQPRLGERVYVDPMASVSGDVELGDDTSVWPMVVIRGDVNRVEIGPRTNIQDGSILHVTHESIRQPEGRALIIGADVTVGHGVILHACTVGDRCLVGMGATVLDGAVLEPDSMVAAGALVPPGKTVRSGTLWRGNPAHFARELCAQEISDLAYNAAHYVRLKDRYLQGQPRKECP